MSKQAESEYHTSHHKLSGDMGHHMIKSYEREREYGHMHSPKVSNGLCDQKKYLGTLHKWLFDSEV